MDTPKGLVILLHNGFGKITVAEALKALPEAWHRIDRGVFEINYSELLDLSKLYDTGYDQYALEHRRFFANKILPYLYEHADYKIIYFGLAPIPLCIDFGHLFHNYRDVLIFQKHHVTKEWGYDYKSDSDEPNDLTTSGIPDKNQKGITDALVRFSISHPINPDDSFEILPNAAEVDISLNKPNEDAINTEQKMIEAGEAIKHVFDELSNNRSSLDKIHLFAAIPCGVAFLTGIKISPNIHSFIQTYQHSRTREPKYTKALLIKGQIAVQRKITEDEKKVSKELRDKSDKQLKSEIKGYLTFNENMSRNRTWYQGLIPLLGQAIMNEQFWKNLPALYETSLNDDAFDFETEVVNNGFFWRMNKWYVDDNFFIAVNRRLKNEEDILMAVRLFLFHEAIHYKKHKLTELTAINIGSFPKVLETADYQADVYAIMNEYGYHSKMIGDITDPKTFFLYAIQVATETMWSFDDAGIELEEIQIRRLNRYMIWYWQYARIEKDGNSLDEIISILEEKPVIELNGLKTKEENNRFFYILEKRRDQPLELGIFHNNELIRDGSATNMAIENLVQGVKEMKGEMILNVMRSFANR